MLCLKKVFVDRYLHCVKKLHHTGTCEPYKKKEVNSIDSQRCKHGKCGPCSKCLKLN